jgi:hypothetical protein
MREAWLLWIWKRLMSWPSTFALSTAGHARPRSVSAAREMYHLLVFWLTLSASEEWWIALVIHWSGFVILYEFLLQGLEETGVDITCTLINLRQDQVSALPISDLKFNLTQICHQLKFVIPKCRIIINVKFKSCQLLQDPSLRDYTATSTSPLKVRFWPTLFRSACHSTSG